MNVKKEHAQTDRAGSMGEEETKRFLGDCGNVPLTRVIITTGEFRETLGGTPQAQD